MHSLKPTILCKEILNAFDNYTTQALIIMSFLHPEIAGHQYILHLVHTKTQRSIFECEDDIFRNLWTRFLLAATAVTKIGYQTCATMT
jgi:hypothetical protein